MIAYPKMNSLLASFKFYPETDSNKNPQQLTLIPGGFLLCEILLSLGRISDHYIAIL